MSDTATQTTGITSLLRQWSEGDENALYELMPHVLSDLRIMARRQLAGEKAGHGLQATEIVNEVFLRLLKPDSVQWANRRQFFYHAGKLVRRVLVDYARKRDRQKRGGDVPHCSLDEIMEVADKRNLNLVALDSALKELQEFNPEGCQIVELKFFVGLTYQEISDNLGMSVSTVRRKWEPTRAWLESRLGGPGKLS